MAIGDKVTDPNLLAILNGVQQPSGGVDPNTPAGARLTGPVLQNTQTEASTQNTQAELPKIHSEAIVAEQKAAQVTDIASAQALFDSKIKDPKSGEKLQDYVSPQDYNDAKKQVTAHGIDTASFDKYFEKSGYIDPGSIQYNTDANLTMKTTAADTKRNYQAMLDQYGNIPSDEKGVTSVRAAGSKVPVLGETGIGGAGARYENLRPGLTSAIRNLFTQGGNLRTTQTEISNWQALTPSIHDSFESNQEAVGSMQKAMLANGQTLDQKHLEQWGLDANGDKTSAKNWEGKAPTSMAQSGLSGFLNDLGQNSGAGQKVGGFFSALGAGLHGSSNNSATGKSGQRYKVTPIQ